MKITKETLLEYILSDSFVSVFSLILSWSTVFTLQNLFVLLVISNGKSYINMQSTTGIYKVKREQSYNFRSELMLQNLGE